MPQRYRTRTAVLAILCGHGVVERRTASAGSHHDRHDDAGRLSRPRRLRRSAARHWRHPPARSSRRQGTAQSGFGIDGGPSGPEIDIGETLRVTLTQPREVVAIRFLSSTTAPSSATRPRRRKVTADGTDVHAVGGRKADDAAATWSGPGTRHEVRHHDLVRHRLLPDLGPVPCTGRRRSHCRAYPGGTLCGQRHEQFGLLRSASSTSRRRRSSSRTARSRGASATVCEVDGNLDSASMRCSVTTRAVPSERDS